MIKFFITLAVLLFVFHSFAQDSDHLDISSLPPEKAIVSFAKFDGYLRELCVELQKDGRRDELLSLIEKSEADPSLECRPCRALYKSIATPCKLDKSKPKQKARATPTPIDNEEPEVIPTAPQVVTNSRIPSATVIDIVSRLTTEIFEEEKFRAPYAVAIEQLVLILRSGADKTAGAKDYFGILAQYLAAPWERAREVIKPNAKQGTNDRDVDHLFDE